MPARKQYSGWYMIRIIIVDRVVENRENLKSNILRFGTETGQMFSISAYSDATAFIASYKCNADIVFIALSGKKNGLRAAAKICGVDADVKIVFMDGTDKYVLDGYSVEAKAFLVGSFGYEELSCAMKRLVSIINADRRSVMLRGANKSFIRLFLCDITYVEVQAHILIYHTNTQVYKVNCGLADAERMLAGYGLFRCNNCYLVNMRWVSRVVKNDVFVCNETLLISRSRKKSFLKVFAEYYDS